MMFQRMMLPRNERRWRLIDHTADMRVEVCGSDLQELFANAAAALTELLGTGSEIRIEKEMDVTLESPGLEELMVDWLREILYYNQVSGWILAQISLEQLSHTTLKARLSFGVRRDEEPPDTEIKAVTYHGISVEKTDLGYCSRILFDI
jgi:SHS2 domain-containing protein